MNGIAPCSRVLSDATVAILAGDNSGSDGSSATEEPQCDWRDDSTLVVLLARDTAAAPGMR
eukprot:1063040-Pleurochrysis_carterae.AAC.1